MVAAEHSIPPWSSGIPDRQAVLRSAHSMNSSVPGSCFQSGARCRSDDNRCNLSHSPDWRTWLTAGRWSSNRRNTAVAGLRRKYSLSGWFLRPIRHRNQEHHTRILPCSRSTECSRFSMYRSTARYNHRCREPGWSLWLWWRRHSRCVADRRPRLLREWDPVAAARSHDSMRTDRPVRHLRPAPAPSR